MTRLDLSSNEELKSLEKHWNDQGYVLLMYIDGDEEKLGCPKDPNQPCNIFNVMMLMVVEDVRQQMATTMTPAVTAANPQMYLVSLILGPATTLLAQLVSRVPFYQNEVLADYFAKIQQLFDWMVDDGKGLIQEDGQSNGKKPDFSSYQPPQVVCGPEFIFDGKSYTPLLFSSLCPGSLLNIEGKMTSVLDGYDKDHVFLKQLTETIVMFAGDSIQRIIPKIFTAIGDSVKPGAKNEEKVSAGLEAIDASIASMYARL